MTRNSISIKTRSTVKPRTIIQVQIQVQMDIGIGIEVIRI